MAIAVLAAVAVGVAIVIGVAAQGQDAPSDAKISTGGNSGQADFDMARRLDGDVTALGSVVAPVVLVEYADYRCPFCGVFARDTLPDLITNYVDAGQLRIEWRDLPIFGEQSTDAAVAARAAGEQGRFWEYHQVLFSDAPERGHADFPRNKLIDFAVKAGVGDLARFTADLDSSTLIARVNVDRNEATGLGITGTPTFLVNGIPISGAQPISTFHDAIEAELARLGQ